MIDSVVTYNLKTFATVLIIPTAFYPDFFNNFYIKIVFGLLLFASSSFGQNPVLAEIKSFAQRGNDTTLEIIRAIS